MKLKKDGSFKNQDDQIRDGKKERQKMESFRIAKIQKEKKRE